MSRGQAIITTLQQHLAIAESRFFRALDEHLLFEASERDLDDPVVVARGLVGPVDRHNFGDAPVQ
ncbi:MAG: hypothetical protein AAFU70_11910, partial [Planctomycetota bacterium]